MSRVLPAKVNARESDSAAIDSAPAAIVGRRLLKLRELSVSEYQRLGMHMRVENA